MHEPTYFGMQLVVYKTGTTSTAPVAVPFSLKPCSNVCKNLLGGRCCCCCKKQKDEEERVFCISLCAESCCWLKHLRLREGDFFVLKVVRRKKKNKSSLWWWAVRWQQHLNLMMRMMNWSEMVLSRRRITTDRCPSKNKVCWFSFCDLVWYTYANVSWVKWNMWKPNCFNSYLLVLRYI